MIYIGIDIAKAKFDSCILIEERYKHKTFDNKTSGFKALLKWLETFGTTDEFHICMEATGNYSFPLAKYLFAKEVNVSIVNPAQIKSFANSELSRNKTDKLDAALIMRFCKERNPRLWSAPSLEEERFKALYRRWDSLKTLKAQEQTRLSASLCEDVCSSIQSLIAYLDEQLEAIEAALDIIVLEHSDLKHRYELLTSIPGIAKTTAYFFLAEIDFDSFSSVSQLVAFAGLNPKHNESGTFKGRASISKVGSSRIRKALYFPAIAAKQWNPLISPLALRLESKGHTQLSIICASMRKLLHLAFGVVKSQSPFDPNYLFRT